MPAILPQCLLHEHATFKSDFVALEVLIRNNFSLEVNIIKSKNMVYLHSQTKKQT